MITSEQARTLLGADVYDRGGDLIGRVGEMYLSSTSRQPNWLLVVDGSVPQRTHVVPCDGAEVTDAGIRLAVDGRVVEQAPDSTSPPNEPISEADHARLTGHYAPYLAPSAGGGEGDDADAMTRSEERLRISTRTEVTGRVRVRRYVETENVQFTVPVRREKISIEHLPPEADSPEADSPEADSPEADSPEADSPDPGAQPGSGNGDGSVTEIVLHEERISIVKEVVPVERVRLSREVITEPFTVEATLRRERIELERPGRGPERLD